MPGRAQSFIIISKLKHVVIAEFEQFDQDKDNALNIEELKKLMEGLGEPQTHRAVKDMIALVDDDKDGKISFREFLMIFREGGHPSKSYLDY